MTLAQSLQQLLNGNKKIILLSILSIFIFTSCSLLSGLPTHDGKPKTESQEGTWTPTTKSQQEETTAENTADTTKTGENNNTTETENSSSAVQSATVDKEQKENNTFKPDTIINISAPTKGVGLLHNYNILVLLPFNTQKNSLSYDDKRIDNKSKVALEFYEGFLQGLRELQADGYNIPLRVYDTQSDQYRTKSLLNSMYERFDMVVGPAYTKCLQEAAAWAKINNTYLISPIASKADFVQENPFFVAINPTVDSHLTKLVQYIKGTQKVNQVTVIANPNSGKDAKLVETLQQQLGAYGGIGDFNTNTSVNLIYDTGDGDTKYENYLTQGVDNHVIVASVSETFASNAVRRLQVVNGRFPVVLYGMYNWRNFKNINIDYLENMNLHISTVTADDDNNMEQANMTAYYQSNVGIAPSDFSKRGYDVANYLFLAMNENGLDLKESLPATGKQNACFMDFDVRAVRSFKGNTKMIENTAVKILEFEDYKFKLVR